MKKALSFAVALGLVAGMASSAVAADNLSLKVDARTRGYRINNGTDYNDNTADRVQRFDQRMRFNLKATANDQVSVDTRLVLSNDNYGTAGTNGAMTHIVDRAHINIKAFGGTYILGRQNASWGNKFLGWGNGVDRIKAVYKAGDLTYGGYLQKTSEGNGADGDGDNDTYAGFVIGKAGDTKWGVLANYIYDDTKSASVPAGESANGYLLDVFLNAKAGPASIMAEFVIKDGDAADNPTGDGYFGGFVGASMAAGPANVKGLLAYYDGNMGDSGASRDCDNDFAPTLLIGTCNETAVMDFGGETKSTNDSSYLVVVGADMKAGDKVTVGGNLAYYLASEEAGTGTEDGTITEIDVWMQYALAQNATYTLGIALGQTDKMSGVAGVDDDILSIGNRIDVAF